MNININISERVAAISMLNEFKGNLDKLAIILDDIKKFTVDDEEWVKAGRTIEAQEGGNAFWRWDDEKGGQKDVDISPITAEYMRATIKDKDEKGEFTIKDKPYISLLAKLS